jgi:hypothetical protein
MSKTSRKLRKQKKREAIAKSRVLRRREEHRKYNKWVANQEMKTKLIEKMKHKHPSAMEKLEGDDLMDLPLETIKKLEKNMCILDSLEEEYNREMENRRKLNEELESQGYLTAEAKLGALSAEQIHAMKERENFNIGEVGGSAECSFVANKKEVADIEVIKANSSGPEVAEEVADVEVVKSDSSESTEE